MPLVHGGAFRVYLDTAYDVLDLECQECLLLPPLDDASYAAIA